MHLRRLFIRGFRSISELDLSFTAGKNVIIGRNNAGKSNIVRALDIVLGESAPAWAKSERITEADFHWRRQVDEHGEVTEATSTEIFIWCELYREQGEDLNWEEIDRCSGYSFWGRKLEDRSTEPTRVQLNVLGDQYHHIFTPNRDQVYTVWVDSKLKNQNKFRTQLDPMHHFAYAFRAILTDQGIFKEIRFLYRESEAEDWVLTFGASVRNELLQSAILPAFRDPTTQLRVSQWTWFGKLMRHLTKDCLDDPALQTALNQVQLEGDRIFVGVTEKVENDALSVSFPGAKLSIQFHGDTDAELYKNCGLYVDDGFKSPLVDKGAGIQSATIMGLFAFYTREVNTSASALLCVEEPELYLHPHARRVISDRLDAFLDSNRNQVIITTHGVEFLRTATDTFHLLLVKKDLQSGTIVQALDAREFLGLLINNNQNEIFFADKVVLCEGLDEHILRATADELFPGELDRQNVSLISVEGKDRLVKMAKVVLELGMACYVLADFDFLLRDPTKPDDFDVKAHPSLEQLPIEFYEQAHVGRSWIGTISKGRNSLRQNSRALFYTARHSSEFNNEKLNTFLSKLRSRGIGVLDGEIEHLSRDYDWVRPDTKKFDLKKVYELREKLTSGEKMSSLFELEPIKQLLMAVLDIKEPGEQAE